MKRWSLLCPIAVLCLALLAGCGDKAGYAEDG